MQKSPLPPSFFLLCALVWSGSLLNLHCSTFICTLFSVTGLAKKRRLSDGKLHYPGKKKSQKLVCQHMYNYTSELRLFEKLSLSSLESSTVKGVAKSATVTSGKRKRSRGEEQGITKCYTVIMWSGLLLNLRRYTFISTLPFSVVYMQECQRRGVQVLVGHRK